MCSNCGSAMGFTVSAATSSVNVGLSIAPGLVMPQMLLSGVFMKTEEGGVVGGGLGWFVGFGSLVGDRGTEEDVSFFFVVGNRGFKVTPKWKPTILRARG